MTIVLDASAAIGYALKRKGWEAIARALDQAALVETPELFVPEVSNGLWREHFHGGMGMEEAEKALERIVDLPDEYVPGVLLYREAFAWAALAEKPAYDMYYLVLARRYNATLVSMDKKLLAFAVKHDVRVFNLD